MSGIFARLLSLLVAVMPAIVLAQDASMSAVAMPEVSPAAIAPALGDGPWLTALPISGPPERLAQLPVLAPMEQPTPAPMPAPEAALQLPPQEDIPAPPPETSVVVGPELAAPAAPPKIWDGSIEFGLNGSSGNSEVFNFRLGVKGKRKTPTNELALNLLYIRNTQDGQDTANRMFMEGRDEWLNPNSPWTRYIHGTGEYDRFRAFDFRIAMDAGLGYSFVKNPATTLIGRFGPGFSREIGGPDESIVPEAVLGLEFEHKFSDRQKLIASTLIYPDLADFGEHRSINKAAWELLIDPSWNLSLQLSVLDRYDSTPNGAKPNDLDYALIALWSF